MTNPNTPANANPHLLNRDFTVIIDRSGSMADPVAAGKSQTRWQAAEEATVALSRECDKYDPDGITVYTFGSQFNRFDNTTPDKVKEIFHNVKPNGSTRLAEVLNDAFFGTNGYITRKKAGQAKQNGELFCVVTDGHPDDEQAVADVIIKASHQLTDEGEVNITLIQVGDDAGAKTFLNNLDDKLEDPTGQGRPGFAKYDIVDTLTVDQLGGKDLTAVLVAAVTEHKQST